jgi:hypothetical protein
VQVAVKRINIQETARSIQVRGLESEEEAVGRVHKYITRCGQAASPWSPSSSLSS